MTVKVELGAIFAPFCAGSIDELRSQISQMAPSLAEYYLDDLLNSSQTVDFLNKRNVKETIYIDDYQIYICYDDEVFLCCEKSNNDLYEESLF